MAVDDSWPDAATSSGVALLGDLVASKQHADRAALQRVLVGALAEVDALVPARQSLQVTVGDEFQGVYATLAEAAAAALLLRLTLLPHVDTRYGLGQGSFTVFDADRVPLSQDGPAWWAAREAVEEAERRAAHPRGRSVRTWFVAVQGPARAGTGAVNAWLSCRDEILARMSARELRLLRRLLLGQQQAEMADSEGISQSAVSQALSRSGAYAVVHSQQLLLDSPPPQDRAGDQQPGQPDHHPQDQPRSPHR